MCNAQIFIGKKTKQMPKFHGQTEEKITYFVTIRNGKKTFPVKFTAPTLPELLNEINKGSGKISDMGIKNATMHNGWKRSQSNQNKLSRGHSVEKQDFLQITETLQEIVATI
ncbi:hypothetical protein KC901_03170 [Patescibacteria group bacterium]|nr:hypothetical protein [Patescibacteria group bacterium]